MIIARELRKVNVAEYLIYMFQVEDIIRLCQFDQVRLDDILITKFDPLNNPIDDIKEWYSNLARVMIDEGIQEKGHLQYLKHLINEVNDFGVRLLETGNEEYQLLYRGAEQPLVDYRKKLDNSQASDVEICITALYSLMLMRIKKIQLSPETSEALERFTKLMAFLANKYKLFEEGKFEL